MAADEIKQSERRARILRLVSEELPPLIKVPVPSSIREADWFRGAALEEALEVYAFPAYQIPL